MATPTVTALTPGTRALASSRPKRGIRGAFLNLPYVGPARVAAADHAVSADLGGGGAEDSKAYRKSDTYDISGNTGGIVGAPATSVTRPSRYRYGPGAGTVQAYIGAGVQGGSAPGAPVDLSGRATDTGVDRFGRALGVANQGGGLGRYTYTNFDGRSTIDGEGGQALGVGRGTQESSGTVTRAVAAPTVGAAANPAAGTIGIVDGTGGVMQVDFHADDITGGANGRKGAEIAVFKRGTDTDEDGALVGFFSADAGTDIGTLFTPGAGTYNVYARWRYPGKAPRSGAGGAIADARVIGRGPFSAVTVRTIT